jgi:hypothetical protein
MNQVSIDVDERRSVAFGTNQVAVPKFVVKGLGHRFYKK